MVENSITVSSSLQEVLKCYTFMFQRSRVKSVAPVSQERRTILLIRTHTRAKKVRRVKNEPCLITLTLKVVSAAFWLVLFKV